jgi:hypothetical protein
MNEKQIKERLSGTRTLMGDAARNRALMGELRQERYLMALGWPKFDWVWEQEPERGVGYHVGPGDPDWAWRSRAT